MTRHPAGHRVTQHRTERAPNLHVLTCTESRPAPTHPDALHKSNSSALPFLGGKVTRTVSPHQRRCQSPRQRQLSENHGVALLIIKSKPPPMQPHHRNDRTHPHWDLPTIAAAIGCERATTTPIGRSSPEVCVPQEDTMFCLGAKNS